MDGRTVAKAVCVTAAAAGIAFAMYRRSAKDDPKESPPPAPPLTALDAVGGHGSKKDKGPPILVLEDMVLKPYQPAQPGKAKGRGELEADFYREITESGHPLKDFVPAYHGVDVVNGTTYLKLENLSHGLTSACVLDLKMGQQTYDETATPAKIERERKKYPPQQVIGFRIVGMKVVRPSTHEVFKSSRDWCMSITPESMQNAIEQFFYDGRIVRYELVGQLVEEIEKIETVLREHPKWRMYGSSLLVAYDATPPDRQWRLRVKMIDFAHVFPIRDGGRDEGYLHGLAFLKNCLRMMLAHASMCEQQSQVGGAHGNIASVGGELIKKEDKPEQFDQEAAFYRSVWETTPPDALSRVMPRLIRVDEQASPRELVISDATALVRGQALGGPSVSIMDIKLGVRSFARECPNEPKTSYFAKYSTFEQELAPGRPEEIWESAVGTSEGPDSLREGKLGKRDYLTFRDASTTSTELGFRLTALVHGDYRVSQADSRSIETRIQFLERLEHFLYNDRGFDVAIATAFMNQLNEILHAVHDSKLFREHEMVGTSLLFLHCDGKAAIRWIDFANTTKGPSEDYNGITEGIHRLSLAIEELIMKYTA